MLEIFNEIFRKQVNLVRVAVNLFSESDTPNQSVYRFIGIVAGQLAPIEMHL